MGWLSRLSGTAQASLATIAFPNPSRSYDAARHGVLFWGNDSAMDVDFFVSDEALRQLQSDVGTEQADLLRAFDLHRSRILEAAAGIYNRQRRGIHVLNASNF
jgi:hypothetical protein